MHEGEVLIAAGFDSGCGDASDRAGELLALRPILWRLFAVVGAGCRYSSGVG